MSDDEKALRGAIKADPLNPLPYGVLNDWLIDQGRDDEVKEWFWTTLEGVKLNVRDIKDDHLWNCLRMVVRRFNLGIRRKKGKRKRLFDLIATQAKVGGGSGIFIEANRRGFDWESRVSHWIMTTPQKMKDEEEERRRIFRFNESSGVD